MKRKPWGFIALLILTALAVAGCYMRQTYEWGVGQAQQVPKQ
jgi:hypothetical protein